MSNATGAAGITQAREDNLTFRELLDSPGSVSDIFPDQLGDIDIDKFHRRFELVCRGYRQLREYHNKTKVLLGRGLYCIQQRPVLYKERGFHTFEAFLQHAVGAYGITRSELYNTLALAKTMPDLTLATCAEIGVSNLYKVSKAIASNTGLDDATREALLAKAKALSVKEFDQYIEDKMHVDKTDTVPGILVVHTTVTIKRAFEMFADNPKIQAYCGTTAPGGILMCMIEECMGEWMAQAENAVIDAEAEEIPPPPEEE